MSDEHHPDPTGPEQPDGPMAAHDADPTNNGRSISDAVEDIGDDEAVQTELPIPGEYSSFGKLIPRGVPIEARLAMRSASVRADGLFDPDKERVMVVPVLPFSYAPTPIREGGTTKRWKITQSMQPREILTAEQGRHLVLNELREHYEAEGADNVVSALDDLKDALAVFEEQAELVPA